ncbi:MAG: hypothetical protein ABFD64_00510 [Armatimonadota bacterium]
MDEQLEQEDREERPGQDEKDLPAGIARLHEEWLQQGLIPTELKEPVELEPVVFPEPVGDYKINVEDARAMLGLSPDAMERLLVGGELDSIQVRFEDGVRRMISQSALSRFVEDTGMAPEISEKLNFPADEINAELESIREEMREMKELHTRQLQQFKDILLLELRNLKEQDRDLTSFVYDLTAALEELNPKLRKRKRTPPPE